MQALASTTLREYHAPPTRMRPRGICASAGYGGQRSLIRLRGHCRGLSWEVTMRNRQLHGADARSLKDFVRQHYCVYTFDGREDEDRLRAAMAAVESADVGPSDDPPVVRDVPRVRMRIDRPSQISEAVRRFLPEVERDPRLHALSFVNPLQVALELAVVVSPLVARIVRRGLASTVTFDTRSLDEHGRLRGLGEIHWRPKTTQRGGEQS